jgi:hypothetical protein
LYSSRLRKIVYQTDDINSAPKSSCWGSTTPFRWIRIVSVWRIQFEHASSFYVGRVCTATIVFICRIVLFGSIRVIGAGSYDTNVTAANRIRSCTPTVAIRTTTVCVCNTVFDRLHRHLSVPAFRANPKVFPTSAIIASTFAFQANAKFSPTICHVWSIVFSKNTK